MERLLLEKRFVRKIVPENSIVIRRAVLADSQSLADFNSAMALETESVQLIETVILQGVKSLIANPHYGFYLVAEAQDEIVASLMVTTEWSDWRNGVFWWVQSVYVKPRWRRQGLYTRLYEKVKTLASETDDICGFRLYVEHDNTIAQKTYSRLGMKETSYKLFEELDSQLIYKK